MVAPFKERNGKGGDLFKTRLGRDRQMPLALDLLVYLQPSRGIADYLLPVLL